ncbi:MAG: Stp1/IreP family PP2C-type Ser/Thr phosphatase [Deltaproteobacteria bacterium]|nr:Stp1/IreP family PP2C-type Ser/Thr phosphatase [Deltaproteobacteria bacterium]
MLINSAAQTDVGRVREKNEDSHFISNELGLYVVADGMGGHLGGQMASGLAAQAVADNIKVVFEQLCSGSGIEPIESSPVPKLLADAVRGACATVFDAAQGNPELQGMGTTVTTLFINSNRAFIAHVGDSRCYLQRADRIIQITDDHSLVNEQIKAGLITREQGRQSRLKNIITRSVGFERDVAVDTFALPIQVNDNLLLCSDGLTNFVDDTEIGLALATLAITEVPSRMIDLANERGGDDNITIICVSLAEEE